MEELYEIKETLIYEVKEQLAHNKEHVCTKELGEVVDMIKDISEAIYYCTITHAMNEGDEHEGDHTAGINHHISAHGLTANEVI